VAVGLASALARRGALPELVRRRRELERLAEDAAGLPAQPSPRAPT
jgi:hypothetical protein